MDMCWACTLGQTPPCGRAVRGVAGVLMRPSFAPAHCVEATKGSLPSLSCRLSLMMGHIECTDQEFSECHFLKLICIVCSTDPGFTSVKLFWSATLFLWKKIYFGRFLCLYCPLLEKKKCLCSLVCVVHQELIRNGLWCLRSWPRRHTKASSTSLVHTPSPSGFTLYVS